VHFCAFFLCFSLVTVAEISDGLCRYGGGKLTLDNSGPSAPSILTAESSPYLGDIGPRVICLFFVMHGNIPGMFLDDDVIFFFLGWRSLSLRDAPWKLQHLRKS